MQRANKSVLFFVLHFKNGDTQFRSLGDLPHEDSIQRADRSTDSKQT